MNKPSNEGPKDIPTRSEQHHTYRDADNSNWRTRGLTEHLRGPPLTGVTRQHEANRQDLHPAQVVSRITNSQSLSELMHHVRGNRQSFDREFRCASAAVSKAAKMINKKSQPDINDFLELAEMARGRLPQMDARSLSTFIYSLAKAGQWKEDLIQEILTQAEPKLKYYNPQGFSNTIWALAHFSYKVASTFIGQLLKEAEPKLRDFNPQDTANVLWALATLNYLDASAFIKQLLWVAEPKLRDFKPQELVNSIWALAKLNYLDGYVFVRQLLYVAEPKLRALKSQELVNIIWALATLKYSDESAFVEQLLREAETKMSEFDPRGFSNTMWALAALKCPDESFIEKLIREAEPKLRDFNSQELSNTIWSLATLNYPGGSAFIKQLLTEAESNLRDFSPQGMANFVWSLAVLDHVDAPLLLKRFLPFLYEFQADELIDSDKTPCFQFLLLMEDKGHVTAEIMSDPQYVKFRKMCQEARTNKRPSSSQLEIFDIVQCLPGCSDATCEQLTEDGIFTIDIALHLNGGRRLAIEVDGPHHFLSDGKALNGNTVLRNRMLENRGWTVVSIPVRNGRIFDQGEAHSFDEKKAYLMNRLGPLLHRF